MASWWRRIRPRVDSGDSWPPVRPPLTMECQRGAHDECGHMEGFVGAAEGEVTLCLCTCHEPCPLARQRSTGHLHFMLTCTCPAHLEIRRNQERAGIDPAEVVRLMEARRQRRAALSEEEREEELKRALVQGYHSVAAQESGQQPPDGMTPGEPPFEVMPPQMARESMVRFLAQKYSAAEAARLLGLTEAQVEAAIQARHEHHMALAKHIWAEQKAQRKAQRRRGG